MLAIVRDITERNRAEEYAAELLRHLSGELTTKSGTLLPEISSASRVPLEAVHSVKLRDQELEALRLLALGKTNPQIAKEMVISVSAVKDYVGRIIDKLGVSDRTQAAVRAVELGLLRDQEK